MPIDTHKQLQDLLRTAEAFRRAMVVSGAVNHVGQSTYMDELRALESALSPANYRILDPLPVEVLIDKMRAWPAADGADGLNGTYVEYLMRQASDSLECWSLVEQLREPEGAEVHLFCDNPDGPPNNALEICDHWTRWGNRRFQGETILDALRAAKAARDAHVEKARGNG